MSSTCLGSKENGKVYLKILGSLLYVKRFRPNSSILTAHNEALLAGYPIRYNITRIELKTFTFSAGSQSLSIDNAVLGRLPKSLIFTMVKDTDFLGTISTNPFNFRHFDLNHYALYVNGRQIPPEGCR